jgi:hypothetical protein
MTGLPLRVCELRKRDTSGAPLGILAGGGSLPVAIAELAARRGRSVHIVGISGEAERGIERFPHTWIAWGEVGKLLEALKTAGADELVIIGGVKRPDLKSVRLDLGAIRNLPLLISLTVGGDDSVLKNVVRFFEAKGLKVIGAHEAAPELVAPVGPLGSHRPGDDVKRDIDRGLKVTRALGLLDVGQAAVVVRGHVLAVEAAEGTDRMLERASELRQWGERARGRREGALVKASKPGQDLRVDMPAIGPRTVERAAAAGLAAIALEAGRVLVAERHEVERLANEAGIAILGVIVE